MNQIYPKLVGKIAQETKSGYWKVVFLPPAVRKSSFFHYCCDAERDSERGFQVVKFMGNVYICLNMC